MTVYIVAQLKFTREALYRRYQERFLGVFSRFDGRALAADENVTVLEGNWHGDKVVMLAFDTEAKARAFMEDSEYQEISRDRRAGADATILLVEGLG